MIMDEAVHLPPGFWPTLPPDAPSRICDHQSEQDHESKLLRAGRHGMQASGFSGSSIREHLLQAAEDRVQRIRTEIPEPLHQAVSVDSAKLIERNKTVSGLKSARNSPRVGLPVRGHRSNDSGAQMFVEFVGRHD
jgi:hypothetical protein